MSIELLWRNRGTGASLYGPPKLLAAFFSDSSHFTITCLYVSVLKSSSVLMHCGNASGEDGCSKSAIPGRSWVKCCRSANEVSQVCGRSVAGPRVRCRRSFGKVSQVCVFAVTCDANQPQGQKSVAGPAFFADLRRFRLPPATPIGLRSKKVSQVRRILQTCDVSAAQVQNPVFNVLGEAGNFFGRGWIPCRQPRPPKWRLRYV